MRVVRVRLLRFRRSSCSASLVSLTALRRRRRPRAAAPALAQTTLRVVKHSDLKIVDPIWTTAYITRDHGYMIYDTLFATDASGQIKPQMIDKYDLSADKLTWTMTLRDGLLWHDGTPVTAEDCVASIRRWGAKDAMGQKMMSFVKDMPVVDAKTFRIVLNAPTGLVLTALGKPSSNVPFMMPKRVAATNPNEQISDYTGSGPFVFKKDEWKPGDKSVYVKWDKYKPRAEPASGLAGGKVAKVDRVEWRQLADQQTAVNALIAGEIDFIEQPSHDLLPILRKDANIKLVDWNPLGNQYAFRFNTTAKPFDNVKIRQAVVLALNQEDFLQAVIGDKQYYKTCKALFVCGTPLASDKGMDGLLESNFAKSQALLKEAGYDGTPIVLLHSTDLQVLTNLAPVAKQLLEKGGFKVDMQSMDWQSVVARAREEGPADAGRLARDADVVGVGRHPEPRVDRVPQRELRQGAVRLAVRRGDGKAARRLRARDRSREAEGDRRGGAGALDAVSDARASRPVVPAGRGAQERRRRRRRARVGVLEHLEDGEVAFLSLSPTLSRRRSRESGNPVML